MGKTEFELESKVEFVRRVLLTSRPGSPPEGASAPSAFLDSRTPRPDLLGTGVRLLRDGKVAVLMVAGGMSTRMGGEVLRGELPIGPVTNRSIFRLQGEKVAALRARFAPRMPWLVMTSANVHERTLRAFRREDFFGVSPDDVWFFQQPTLPVLDANLQAVPTEAGAFLESPVGHGGVLEALATSALLPRLRRRGVEYIFYFQYPNVLERIADPLLVGYHHTESFDFTIKAVTGYRPEEELGRCVQSNGSLRVVEYHVFKTGGSREWLHSVPANTGAHVFSVSFLERCLGEGVSLPYHAVTHNAASEAPKPLRKAEQLVFDLLPHANKTGLLVAPRDKTHAPVKRMRGLHSVESGRRALSALYRGWLEDAGAAPADPRAAADYRLEISPLYALCGSDLVGKLPRGFRYHDGLTLC